MRPPLAAYSHLHTGKVRDLYRIDDDHVLFVASDRISAFDYVLSTPIPDKGRVLTALSVFFFEHLGERHHYVAPIDDPRIPAEVLGRALIVESLQMVPVECIARGYLTGSAWAEYHATGKVNGFSLPAGLSENARLDPPLFTPTTKAAVGAHDENMSFTEVVDLVGGDRAEQLRDATLRIYQTAADLVATRGLTLVDTKLEFGVSAAGELVVADEVLTPDSSRYWPAHRPGVSLDKQLVRNWLTSEDSGWSRASSEPPPPLAPAVVAVTQERYIQLYEQISGLSFQAWPTAEIHPS